MNSRPIGSQNSCPEKAVNGVSIAFGIAFEARPDRALLPTRLQSHISRYVPYDRSALLRFHRHKAGCFKGDFSVSTKLQALDATMELSRRGYFTVGALQEGFRILTAEGKLQPVPCRVHAILQLRTIGILSPE